MNDAIKLAKELSALAWDLHEELSVTMPAEAFSGETFETLRITLTPEQMISHIQHVISRTLTVVIADLRGES